MYKKFLTFIMVILLVGVVAVPAYLVYGEVMRRMRL